MGKVAVELNDAGIVVADETGVLAVEPGYAFLERGRIRTGLDAVAHARREPRRASNRFWSALSVEPGSAGLDGPTSTAELAYTQLADLWKRFGEGASDALLVVPGSYRGEQLGIVLGLAQECGMPVRALVDAAAAASVRPYPGKQLLYVDASLHRIVSTWVEQREEAFVRAEHEIPTTGLANITEAFARRFAETFMLATRFNPFHRAETEQQLYDRLPEWLAAFHEQGEIECVLRDGDEEFRTVVGRDAALGAVGGFYRSVVQLIAQNREPGTSLAVQLSQRLGALPGFVAELARLDDARIERLEPGHAARGALLAADELVAAGGDVKLVKHLRWRAPAADIDAAAHAPAEPPRLAGAAAPTHVVYRGMVYRVDARGLVVGREPADGRRTIVVEAATGGVSRAHCELVLRDGELRVVDLSRFGTFVNEKRISGETILRRADVIRVGSPGAELTVVSMEPAHGA
ncbi:MAG TPA: FHA domain-containing protein [Gammaproteobacteria bacterium]|nr:FHA domain-containing protein [Gammaproteobacteria bacterium]